MYQELTKINNGQAHRPRKRLRRVSVAVTSLLIAATYALYTGAERMPSALLPLYVLAGLAAGGAVLTPIFMVRSFPTPVRFSGVSLSYNIAYAIFGGVTPLLVSWLARLNRFSPAHYVGAVAVLGLLATVMTPATHLSHDRTES